MLLGIGVVGLAYVARVASHIRRQEAYSPDRGDWLWFVCLPALAFASVVISGLAVRGSSSASPNMAGGSAMLLLLIGIHNAWDAAVYMVANSTADRPGDESTLS